MSWALHHLESDVDAEALSRIEFKGRLYRHRRKHPRSVATLCGPVTLWRRLYEPLGRHGRSIHPLELRVGLEAGLATPALAERVGRWATEHAQHDLLKMLQADHGVHGSCKVGPRHNLPSQSPQQPPNGHGATPRGRPGRATHQLARSGSRFHRSLSAHPIGGS